MASLSLTPWGQQALQNEEQAEKRPTPRRKITATLMGVCAPPTANLMGSLPPPPQQ